MFAAATPVFASTYIVTVAGLGGEPDYEQRFTMLATDIDKLLRTAAQTDRIVETLKGADATRAKLEAALEPDRRAGQTAGRFRADDDRPRNFRWHRIQVQSARTGYFGAELAALLNRIPAGRQLVVDMTSASGGAIAR